MEKIQSHRDLRVYQSAMDAALRIFELTKSFPPEERFSLTDQLRRSTRSVCANIAEAWRKRRYQAHFVSKLSDSEGEAEETRVWIELAARCGYLRKADAEGLDQAYDRILAQLVSMIVHPEQWIIRPKTDPEPGGRTDGVERKPPPQMERGQSRQSYRSPPRS